MGSPAARIVFTHDAQQQRAQHGGGSGRPAAARRHRRRCVLDTVKKAASRRGGAGGDLLLLALARRNSREALKDAAGCWPPRIRPRRSAWLRRRQGARQLRLAAASCQRGIGRPGGRRDLGQPRAFN